MPRRLNRDSNAFSKPNRHLEKTPPYHIILICASTIILLVRTSAESLTCPVQSPSLGGGGGGGSLLHLAVHIREIRHGVGGGKKKKKGKGGRKKGALTSAFAPPDLRQRVVKRRRGKKKIPPWSLSVCKNRRAKRSHGFLEEKRKKKKSTPPRSPGPNWMVRLAPGKGGEKKSPNPDNTERNRGKKKGKKKKKKWPLQMKSIACQMGKARRAGRGGRKKR